MNPNKPLKTLFCFLLTLCSNFLLHAQITGPEQDCIHAIPVCQTQYVQTSSYQGIGAVQDVNQNNSCLENAENNSVWYIFTITIAGRLEFSIIPQAADDYDFALYNLTGHSCADIFNGGLEVECSYSYTTGPVTGGPINVTVGETYALVVDNFSSSTTGYTIDFNPNNASTASIIDFISPSIDSVRPPDCEHPTTILVAFTEPILCNTINPSGNQFNLTGPSSLTVTHAECTDASNASVELTLSGPVDVAGNYQLTFNGNVVADLCGNAAMNDTLTFYAPVGIVTDFTFTCNEKDFSFTNTSFSADTFTSVWTFSDGDTSTDFNPTHFFNLQGTHTVTLTNENAQCTSTKTEAITVKDTFYADFSYSSTGSQVIDFTDESTPGTTDFLWDLGNGSFNLAQNLSVYYDPGTYRVCLTASLGCYSDSICQLVTVDSITSVKQLSGNDISIQIFPHPVNGIAQVNLLNYPAAKGEATLYNAFGEEVSTLLFNSRSFEMDLNAIPSGVYLLKIETGNVLAVKKVMKL